MNKPFRLMEYVWLFLFVILLLLAVGEAINKGFTRNCIILLGLSALSFFMFFARKKLREKEEKDNEE